MRMTFLVLGLVTAFGCTKKVHKTDTDTGSGSSAPAVVVTTGGSGSAAPVAVVVAGSAAAPVAPPAASGPVTVDPEIASRVKAIVANCKVDVDSNSINDCKAGEDSAIFKYASENMAKATGLFESLAEIASTDGAKDPKVLVAIVETWPGFSDHDFEKKASTPAAADRIIKLYDKVNPKSDRWGNAARVPLLAGKHAELAAALAKLGDDRAELRQDAYNSFLQFGGMYALADLQNIVKTGKTPADKDNALMAVGIAAHEGAMADADKTKACDWVKTVAADPALEDDALRGALDSLSRCGSAYIDAGLATIDANIKAKHLGPVTVDALHHMCWAEGVIGGSMNGSKEQCAKAFALLETGVNDKGQQGDSMTSASFTAEMLGKNSPDLKPKAKALIAKLSTNPDKGVADAAKRNLADLK
jgi:hypothetical protein